MLEHKFLAIYIGFQPVFSLQPSFLLLYLEITVVFNPLAFVGF